MRTTRKPKIHWNCGSSSEVEIGCGSKRPKRCTQDLSRVTCHGCLESLRDYLLRANSDLKPVVLQGRKERDRLLEVVANLQGQLDSAGVQIGDLQVQLTNNRDAVDLTAQALDEATGTIADLQDKLKRKTAHQKQTEEHFTEYRRKYLDADGIRKEKQMCIDVLRGDIAKNEKRIKSQSDRIEQVVKDRDYWKLRTEEETRKGAFEKGQKEARDHSLSLADQRICTLEDLVSSLRKEAVFAKDVLCQCGNLSGYVETAIEKLIWAIKAVDQAEADMGISFKSTGTNPAPSDQDKEPFEIKGDLLEKIKRQERHIETLVQRIGNLEDVKEILERRDQNQVEKMRSTRKELEEMREKAGHSAYAADQWNKIREPLDEGIATLNLILTDKKIRAWMCRNDPQAIKQVYDGARKLRGFGTYGLERRLPLNWLNEVWNDISKALDGKILSPPDCYISDHLDQFISDPEQLQTLTAHDYSLRVIVNLIDMYRGKLNDHTGAKVAGELKQELEWTRKKREEALNYSDKLEKLRIRQKDEISHLFQQAHDLKEALAGETHIRIQSEEFSNQKSLRIKELEKKLSEASESKDETPDTESPSKEDRPSQADSGASEHV